jgi:Ca-activated chloride channel homolog
MINRFLLLLIFIIIGSPLFAQQENAEIRRGNRGFNSENFQEAEFNYRKALEQNQSNLKALYNLASSLYKQGRFEEAANILDGMAQMPMSDSEKADVYHNLGNANLSNQKIKEGVEAYKNSLRLRPDDMDTRHNLAHALRLLQEQEQQQQNQDQDKDQQKDDKDKKDQPKDQEQKQDDEKKQDQPRPDQISPQDAQRILDALNQQEQKIQEKIEREQIQAKPVRPEREW